MSNIDKPPTNLEEYCERAHANYNITGRGIEGTTIHMPCPFCSAADWVIHKVIESKEALGRGGTCKECGRSGQCLFKDKPGSTEFELVQTGGDPLPDWMEYKPRDIRYTPVGHD